MDILNALAAAQEAKLMRSAAEVEKEAFQQHALTTGLRARLPQNQFFTGFVKEYQRNLDASLEHSYAKWKMPGAGKGNQKSSADPLTGSRSLAKP